MVSYLLPLSFLKLKIFPRGQLSLSYPLSCPGINWIWFPAGTQQDFMKYFHQVILSLFGNRRSQRGCYIIGILFSSFLLFFYDHKILKEITASETLNCTVFQHQLKDTKKEIEGLNKEIEDLKEPKLVSELTSSLFYPSDETNAFFTRATTTALALTSVKVKELPHMLVQTKPEFFVCNAPKSGCTAWNYFWEYVNTGVRWNNSVIETRPGIIYQHWLKKAQDNSGVMPKWYHNRSESEIITMGKQYEIVAIGRNPYVRFLSSYKDWLHRVKKNETQVPFDKFTKVVLNATNGDVSSRQFFEGQPLNHIYPISTICKIGTVNTMVLRVEEQALWFNQFLTKFHLKIKMDEYTSYGNIVFSSGLHKGSFVKDFTEQIFGRKPWPSALFNSSHHRGSADQLSKYYTPSIAKQVTEIAFDDLMNFGYPLWNGVTENFRMV